MIRYISYHSFFMIYFVYEKNELYTTYLWFIIYCGIFYLFLQCQPCSLFLYRYHSAWPRIFFCRTHLFYYYQKRKNTYLVARLITMYLRLFGMYHGIHDISNISNLLGGSYEEINKMFIYCMYIMFFYFSCLCKSWRRGRRIRRWWRRRQFLKWSYTSL